MMLASTSSSFTTLLGLSPLRLYWLDLELDLDGLLVYDSQRLQAQTQE